jgi:hypothetical protein
VQVEGISSSTVFCCTLPIDIQYRLEIASGRGLESLLQLSFSYPNADGWLACNNLEIVTDRDIVYRLVAVSGRGTLVPPLRLRQGTKMLFGCGPAHSGGKPALAWSAAC